MDVSLFISIFVCGALVTTLLTQAIKQFYYNRNKQASPNVIALINAIVVGSGGTAFVYSLMEIEWNLNNILCLVAMTLFVWMGSMIGYTKILETIKQFKIWKNDNDITKTITEIVDDTNKVE